MEAVTGAWRKVKAVRTLMGEGQVDVSVPACFLTYKMWTSD